MAMRLQNLNLVWLAKAVAVTNAGTVTSDSFDSLGFREVAIIIQSTTADAATNKPSVCKVQHSDTTDSTNFGDITALVGGGTGGFTIPNMPTSTTTAPYALLSVNMKGKKRYLRVLVSPLTSQTFNIVAIGDRPEQSPITTTTQNVAVFAAG